MKTTSLNIMDLCVRCYSHCRYCLLSWDGKCLGVEYERSVAYSRRFYEWLKITHKDINFTYYFGYSMDHPALPNAIRFMQETNSPGGEFLQFNGMQMRTRAELDTLFTTIAELGIKLIDLTFYGTKEYHDRFAGRKGDFDLLMDSMGIALEKGLNVEVGIPVTKENLSQIDELLTQLPEDKIKIFIFTPHSGGRGISLLDAKITMDDYDDLSPHAKKYFNRSRNRTPAEWLCDPGPAPKNRILTLSLLPSNIDLLEKQAFEDTLKDLEKLDEAYHDKIPDFQGLLKRYADPEDRRLYSKKDLSLIYSKRFMDEENIVVTDVTDERFSGSLRY